MELIRLATIRFRENKVFDAIEDGVQDLIKLMKQIANMNGTNMLITSDHGFLYQHDSYLTVISMILLQREHL